jgi:hypothetical protein
MDDSENQLVVLLTIIPGIPNNRAGQFNGISGDSIPTNPERSASMIEKSANPTVNNKPISIDRYIILP